MGSDDLLVTIWYDQAGIEDVTQSDLARMPYLALQGVLYTNAKGQVAIYNPTQNPCRFLEGATNPSMPDFAAYLVAQPMKEEPNQAAVYMNNQAGDRFLFGNKNAFMANKRDGNFVSRKSYPITIGQLNISASDDTSNSSNFSVNNNPSNGSVAIGVEGVLRNFAIFSQLDSLNRYGMEGYINEVLIYGSSQPSVTPNLVNSLNEYYGAF